ncbi:hypothetical protein AB0M35_27525, partial [Micromonospora sp. NPDC051196]|uniref:hypothetical protein n=1 Tax=Micromonospora sp. NPDC051196 TaxID=3155281 RepID=UPI00341F0973
MMGRESDVEARLMSLVESYKGVRRDAIGPVARDGVLPLSFGQQRLWFLEQLDLARREYVEA